LQRRPPETLRFGYQRRNPSGEILGIETRSGESFYQQAIFAQYQNGVNSGSLSKRARKISDVGHLVGEKLRS
jgi:hypothetical protein